MIVRFLFVRAFTPLGAGLAIVGLLERRAVADDDRRLWWIWGLSASVTPGDAGTEAPSRVLLPDPGAGGGRGNRYALNDLARRAGRARFRALARFDRAVPAPGPVNVADAGRVAGPDRGVPGRRTTTPADAWVIAPEALLFQADRRGCRLEWTPSAVRRAAGEWGAEERGPEPARTGRILPTPGARYFADLGDRQADPRRMALHDGVRRRYKVIVDRPEVIIADLVVAEMNPHAN